jgi:hypothetical protein
MRSLSEAIPETKEDSLMRISCWDVSIRLFAVAWVLMSHPPSMAASSTASRDVVGSIESHGWVQVGDVQMPTVGTLFAGDQVTTNNGVAVIQYKNRARILLASESRANFAPKRVQLEMGLMTFQTTLMDGVVFAAATLRMEPTSLRAAANVILTEHRASVVVTRGTFKVLDRTGVQLASLNAGDARLFEESPAASSRPAASPAPERAAAPPRGGEAKKFALRAPVKGLEIGNPGPVRSVGVNNSVDALQTLLAAAQARATTLQTQANTLRSISPQGEVISADVATKIAELATLQQQLASGANATAQMATQLDAIIAAIDADNASFRPCETPAASRAASPSRVSMICQP